MTANGLHGSEVKYVDRDGVCTMCGNGRTIRPDPTSVDLVARLATQNATKINLDHLSL